MPDLPPPVPAIEIVVSSTGMSKGLAQTDGPQFLARGEVAIGTVYAGAYVKNVTSTSADGEAAAIVGLRKSVAGFDFTVSAAWKRAVDPAAGSDASALEVNGTISRKIGRVTPRLAVTWSPDDLGSTERTTFAEASVAYRIAERWSASTALGRRERTGGPDYTAWNAGVAWNRVKPLALDLRYYDTNGADEFAFRKRLVLSARLKF